MLPLQLCDRVGEDVFLFSQCYLSQLTTRSWRATLEPVEHNATCNRLGSFLKHILLLLNCRHFLRNHTLIVSSMFSHFSLLAEFVCLSVQLFFKAFWSMMLNSISPSSKSAKRCSVLCMARALHKICVVLWYVMAYLFFVHKPLPSPVTNISKCACRYKCAGLTHFLALQFHDTSEKKCVLQTYRFFVQLIVW